MEHTDFTVERPRGKVLGYVDGVEPAGGTVAEATLAHLPPMTNYESLLLEARNAGFAVACVGHVEALGFLLLVALKKSRCWEVFAGAHHRLERISVDAKTSFDFGGGMFLTGRDQRGKMVSVLIPHRDQENLGLIATFNGERVRAF
jgi:hypothetical protein